MEGEHRGERSCGRGDRAIPNLADIGGGGTWSERTRGRRHLDHQLQPYLADVEKSLLEASVHESQLEEALQTRTTIGQAVGLLMAHEGLTADEAFAKLVHVSQNANIKLRDIAARYVEAWEEKVEAPKEL